MVAYSFKKQFREPILTGTKRQTIRADRKRHAVPGEELQLYTGMRTRQCAIIARAVCVQVEPVRLVLRRRVEMAGGSVAGFTSGWVEISDSIIGSSNELDAFAQSDGFVDWDGMVAFWDREHPDVESFSGVLIGWGDLQLPSEARP